MSAACDKMVEVIFSTMPNTTPILNIKRTFSDGVTEDEIFQSILVDRGITDIKHFLNPPHPRDIPSSTLFPNKTSWKKTMAILKKIHKNGSRIVVYSDYDADGVTGGAIMWEGLTKLGFDVMPYIPDRKTEGYGFSEKGIDAVIAQHNPSLIISVDHGIVGHKQIAYAAEKGVPIIVTDHHQKQEGDPPEAYAVFHTDKLSGSGVAYFFIKEVYEVFGKSLSDDYLALAAIGTVADLVPLTGASRSIVKFGLVSLCTTPRLGLRHMIKEAGIDGKQIDTYHIGYILAPRINAFGRLEHALDALRLLCTTSYDKAVTLSAKAGSINKRRQDIVEVAVKQALTMAKPNEKLIILESHDWEEGIMGLIAGKILQTYQRPTMVITHHDGFAKASVRSVPGVDIMNFLTDLRDFFIDMGGHKAAAGFTISQENLKKFLQVAGKKARSEITDAMLVPQVLIDAQVPFKSLNINLATMMNVMKPFGMANAQPVFLTEAQVHDVMPLGKKAGHTKLVLNNSGVFLEALLFNTPFSQAPKKGSALQCALELEMKEWRGKESVQAIVRHLVTTSYN